MSILMQDVMLYGGGECLQQFGVPFWRMNRGQDVPATMTRSGAVGSFTGKDGIVRSSSADRLRVEWIDGIPYFSLEEVRENVCLQSEDLSTTWIDINTPTLGTPHTASGVSLDLLGDNDAGSVEGQQQIVGFTGDAVKAISVFAKEGLSPNALGSDVVLRDATAVVNRLRAVITWTDGVPTVVMATGSEVREPEALADGVYRFHFATTAVVAANTNAIQLYPTNSGTASETGDVYIGGIQAEDALTPSSYVATTTVAVTRNADTLYSDFFAPPQEMTVYVKCLEGGTKDVISGGVFHIGGTSSGGDARFQIHSDGAGKYVARHDNGIDNRNTQGSQLPEPDLGALNEFRAVLNGDGSVFLGQSIDNGAEVVSSTTLPAELQGAWNNTRLYLGSRGTGERGVGRFAAVKVVRGVRSRSDMRALFALQAA